MVLRNAVEVVDEVISFLVNQKHQFEMAEADDVNGVMEDVSMIGTAIMCLQENGVTDEQINSLIRLLIPPKEVQS